MDISYLLLLQNFRNNTHDFFSPFMLFISDFSIYYLVLIPAFIYWSVNKKSGLFILASFEVGRAINAFLKLTACIYRPWIRDSRVLPFGNSKSTATGYSFPSGHSTYAMALYGGLTVEAWPQKRLRILAVLSVILLLLTGLSRNYLGVHTPQDVFVGFASTALVLFGMKKLFAYLEKNPEKENWFLLGGILFAVILLIYFWFKPYPQDYIDGKLIVDPAVMKRNGFDDAGVLIWFCIARFIEKKWIRFEVTGLNVKGIIVSIIGCIPYICITRLLPTPLLSFFGQYWGRFVYAGLQIVYIIVLWPLIIKLFVNKKKVD